VGRKEQVAVMLCVCTIVI